MSESPEANTVDTSKHEDKEFDVIAYSGMVSRSGYDQLCDHLRDYKSSTATKAYLIPLTVGGDPDAGYRIARAIGHLYPDDVRALIPDVCKSAGTLMCIGANELVICDKGELGPLDIQLSKKDEIFELASGLDISQAIAAIQSASMVTFRHLLFELKLEGGLGTKLAAELASNLTSGLFAPIAAQIDPIRLGEHQRAMNIADAYGQRLNRKFSNTTDEQIRQLLSAYPTHGFVIDRKEAAELFSRVREPSKEEALIGEVARRAMLSSGTSPESYDPKVRVFKLEEILRHMNAQEVKDEGYEDENEGPNDESAAKPASGDPESNEASKLTEGADT
ncbi:hypothetical protein [Microbulbifer sp. TRSA007]|uniref:hypothetical protein n=1 Tax=unclassified Microbulbifer TaxID=2619833 RepID=UPI004039EB10